MRPPQLPPQLPDPYLEGIAKRSAPTLPTPAAYNEPWTIQQDGRDRLVVIVDGTLSRTDVFRLVGQLERAGAAM